MAAKEYERAVGYLTRYFATEEQLRGIGEIADLTSDAATAQAVTVCPPPPSLYPHTHTHTHRQTQARAHTRTFTVANHFRMF